MNRRRWSLPLGGTENESWFSGGGHGVCAGGGKSGSGVRQTSSNEVSYLRLLCWKA